MSKSKPLLIITKKKKIDEGFATYFILVTTLHVAYQIDSHPEWDDLQTDGENYGFLSSD